MDRDNEIRELQQRVAYLESCMGSPLERQYNQFRNQAAASQRLAHMIPTPQGTPMPGPGGLYSQGQAQSPYNQQSGLSQGPTTGLGGLQGRCPHCGK